jgi:hypothetical protein
MSGLHGAAAHIDRCFGLVFELLDGKDAMDIGQVIEVLLEFCKFRLDLRPQCRRHINVVPGDSQLHVVLL